MIGAQELLTHALQLPLDERASMAHHLLLSLEGEPFEEDYETAWEEELIQRVRSLDEGQSVAVDWREAHEEIRLKLREKKA